MRQFWNIPFAIFLMFDVIRKINPLLDFQTKKASVPHDKIKATILLSDIENLKPDLPQLRAV